MKQAMGRDDWPMFEEAIDVELYGHKKIGTFKLEDEEYVFNQGAPLYETRFVCRSIDERQTIEIEQNC